MKRIDMHQLGVGIANQLKEFALVGFAGAIALAIIAGFVMFEVELMKLPGDLYILGSLTCAWTGVMALAIISAIRNQADRIATMLIQIDEENDRRDDEMHEAVFLVRDQVDYLVRREVRRDEFAAHPLASPDRARAAEERDRAIGRMSRDVQSELARLDIARGY